MVTQVTSFLRSPQVINFLCECIHSPTITSLPQIMILTSLINKVLSKPRIVQPVSLYWQIAVCSFSGADSYPISILQNFSQVV